MAETLTKPYRAALDFLYGFIDYERTTGWRYDDAGFDLGRVHDLLGVLGDPHRHGWFVHVAGTNGKGSVAAMIASVLVRTGVRTGLYTSPHLVTFRERIRIDDVMMSRADVVEGVARLAPLTATRPGMTFFDVWTSLAFDHFAHENVDAAVIEVGMGGRLDTTNVITPRVSVITPVSLDHVGKLGSTLVAIAGEKAGIIKPGVPVVSSPQEPEVAALLRERADAAGSPFYLVGLDATYAVMADAVDYRGLTWSFDDLHVPLAGDFQGMNAATALLALEVLGLHNDGITPDAARAGIGLVRWPGRLHTVSDAPEIIVDGACNPGAMRAVAAHIAAKSPRERVTAVVAMCRDKDCGAVMRVLAEVASRFVVTSAANPRSMPPEELACLAPPGVEVIIEPEAGAALERAVACAGTAGTVIATGSLYLVGEILRSRGPSGV